MQLQQNIGKNQQQKKMTSEIQKQFLITSKIGNGNFSTVYLAKHIQTREIVAIKTLKNHISIAVKQAQILKKLNHPNVIKFFKFQKPKNKQQALIVLEYVPENILQLYEAQQYGLKQDQVKCILFQCCLGLNHIHKKGIIHRDIKPENIMINKNKAEVKLIDFGLAIEQDNCVTEYVATRWYRAPQNLLGTKQYTVAIDIFSLGCVVVELYLGNPLFPGSDNLDQISKILNIIGQPTLQSWRKGYQMFIKLGIEFQMESSKRRDSLKNILSTCSEGFAKLIQKMLILNPVKRATAQQILKDPYFKDIQKMVPPHVYEHYLSEITLPGANEIKQPQKLGRRRSSSKQKVLYMSQQKSFGIFSSFKSTQNQKFQQELKGQKTIKSPTKIQVSKKIQQEHLVSEPCQNNVNVEPKNLVQNPSMKKFAVDQQQQVRNFEVHSSNTKKPNDKSDEKFIKITTNLKNVKLVNLKSNQQFKSSRAEQNFAISIGGTHNELKNSKSERLAFRGFNQPKHKLSGKQCGLIVTTKKQQSTNEQKFQKGSVKNKKVMDYFKKLQIVKQSPLVQKQKPKIPNSKSSQANYQSLSNTHTKNQEIFSSTAKKLTIKQTARKTISQNTHMHYNMENSPKHLKLVQNKSYNDILKSVQASSNHLHQKHKIRSSNTLYVQNPSAHNYQIQKSSTIKQKSTRNPLQKAIVKSIDLRKQRIQHESHNLGIYRSSVEIPKQQNQQFSQSNQHDQIFLASTQDFDPVVSNSKNFMTAPPSKIKISPNRPVQNKIKLVSVRNQTSNNIPTNIPTNIPNNIPTNIPTNIPSNIPNNIPTNIPSSIPNNVPTNIPSNIPTNISNNISTNIPSNIPNNISTNIPSNIPNNVPTNIPSNIPTNIPSLQLKDQSTFLRKIETEGNFISTQRDFDTQIKKVSNPDQLNLKYYTPINSSRNQIYCLQNSQQKQPSEYANTPFNEEKKHFKSLQHQQFNIQKAENRYRFSHYDNKVRNYPKNNFSNSLASSICLNSNVYLDTETRKEEKHIQKTQTALSQLRESITGLSQSLNEAALLSERTQRFNSKNININLNLNICEIPSRKL